MSKAVKAKLSYHQIQKTLFLGFVSSSCFIILLTKLLNAYGDNNLISLFTFCGVALSFVLGSFFDKFEFGRKKAFANWMFLLLASIIALGFSNLFLTIISSHFKIIFAFSIIYLLSIFLTYTAIGYLVFNVKQNQQKDISSIFGIYIIGIVIGVIITEMILLNFFGSAWAIIFNVCLLLWCYIYDMKDLHQEIVGLSAVIAILVIAFGVNVQLLGHPYLLEQSQKQFAKNHELVSANSSIAETLIASVEQRDKQQGYAYLQLIHKILYSDLNLNNKNVLVLGIGGYQLAKNNNKHIHFTYFNYSSNDRPSACAFLDLLSEGNNYLTTTNKIDWRPNMPFQVIVANIFPKDRQIPANLLSYQQISKIRQALPENGTAILNVVARPTLSNTYSKRVDNTIRAVFPNCMEIPLIYGPQPTNIIYICRKSKAEADKAIYTNASGNPQLTVFNQFLEHESHGFL